MGFDEVGSGPRYNVYLSRPELERLHERIAMLEAALRMARAELEYVHFDCRDRSYHRTVACIDTLLGETDR